MNRRIQSDIHPDADSLNAFVERALPDTERARIVAHMAECGRCREVVFLAQAATEPEAGEATPVAREVRPARTSGWLGGAVAKWKVAWIPVAALAAVGGVALWIQKPAAPPAVTIARNESQPAPETSNAAQQLAVKGASESRAGKTAPAQAAPRANQQTERKVAQPAIPRAQQGAGIREEPAGDPAVHPESGAAIAPPPQQMAPPNAAPPLSTFAKTHWQPMPQATEITEASANPLVPPRASGGPAVMSIHGTVAPMDSAARTAFTSQNSRPALSGFRPQALNGMMAMKLARNLRLPSGLNPVSSAAVLDRILALDSAGALFLSLDAGKTWEVVTPQWRGKAVEVVAQPRAALRAEAQHAGAEGVSAPTAWEAAPGATDSAAERQTGAVPPSNSSAPPPVPASLFKLANERHETWVSADGKTWREE